jgi:hypothetical protein
VGETRVELQHLLEDLRDAYTRSLEETILPGIAANALDSGASRIGFHPADGMLAVVHDGRAMRRRELTRHHDVAASTRTQGEGIALFDFVTDRGMLTASGAVSITIGRV